MASPEPEPPYYILVSHSPLDSQNTSSTLSHPVVQYHYADDSPLALLPHTPDEHVLVLDYTDLTSSGVDSASVPTVKSISRNLAVTGVKVSEAPGAATAHEELQINRNDKMYIVETCTTTEDRTSSDGTQMDVGNAQASLVRFNQRNAIIRRALEYPDTLKGDLDPKTSSPPPSTS